MKMPTTIKIGNYFYDIQGEGRNMGKPAFFLTMARCNLNCNSERGMWDCDTNHLWPTGYHIELNLLLERMRTLLPQQNKNISVVITGGEPLLQQKPLLSFLTRLNGRYFIEVITNGTIKPIKELVEKVDMWTVDPKLPSSGNLYQQFFNEEALDYLTSLKNSYLKFTVARDLDVDDIYNFYGAYILKVGVGNVYLQPAATTAEEYLRLSPEIIELCKRYRFMFSSRLHLNTYEKNGRVELLPRFSNHRNMLEPI